MSVDLFRSALACEIEGSAKAVFLILAWHADPITGEAWPSNETIAKEAGVNVRSVRRAKARLKELGLILPAGKCGGRYSDVYRILFQQVREDRESPLSVSEGGQRVPPESDSGRTECPSGRTECPSGRTECPPIDKERQRKTKRVGRFTPPPLSEWMEFSRSLNENWPEADRESAWHHYEAKGWMIGKSKAKDWKACCRTCLNNWKGRNEKTGRNRNQGTFNAAPQQGEWRGLIHA